MVITLLIYRSLLKSLTKSGIEFNLRTLVDRTTHCNNFSHLNWRPFHHSFVLLVAITPSCLWLQDRVLSDIIIAIVLINLAILVLRQCSNQDTSTCCWIHQLVVCSLFLINNLIWHPYLLDNINLLRSNNNHLRATLIARSLLPLFLRKGVIESLSPLKRLILVWQLMSGGEGTRTSLFIKLIFTQQSFRTLSNITGWSLYYLNSTTTVAHVLSAFVRIIEGKMFNIGGVSWRIRCGRRVLSINKLVQYSLVFENSSSVWRTRWLLIRICIILFLFTVVIKCKLHSIAANCRRHLWRWAIALSENLDICSLLCLWLVRIDILQLFSFYRSANVVGNVSEFVESSFLFHLIWRFQHTICYRASGQFILLRNSVQ